MKNRFAAMVFGFCICLAVPCLTWAEESPEGSDPSAESPDPSLERQKLEVEKARAEAEKANAEVEKANAEAQKARAEAEKAKAETERAKIEARSNDTRNIQKNNNFTFNPLGILLGGISLTYTRGFVDLISISFAGTYVAPLWIPAHIVGGEFDFLFWIRHPNNGFFVGPYFQVSHTFPTDTDAYIGVTTVGPGVVLGWRWIWNNGFNLGLGGGFAWAFAVGWDCPADADCHLIGGGPSPRLLLDLGYAF